MKVLGAYCRMRPAFEPRVMNIRDDTAMMRKYYTKGYAHSHAPGTTVSDSKIRPQNPKGLRARQRVESSKSIWRKM